MTPFRERGFAVVIVGLLLFGAGFAAWYAWPRSDPSAELDAFVRDVATRSFDAAHARTSARLRERIAREDFEGALEALDALRSASGVQWSKTARERIEGVRAERWEQCVKLAGVAAFVATRMIREDDAWRVDALAIGESELDDDARVGSYCRRSRVR